MEFSVNDADAMVIQCKDCETEPADYILFALIGVVGLIFIISICALLFNKNKFPKLPGFYVVDEAKWLSLMIFALQFGVFLTNIKIN